MNGLFMSREDYKRKAELYEDKKGLDKLSDEDLA